MKFKMLSTFSRQTWKNLQSNNFSNINSFENEMLKVKSMEHTAYTDL